MTITERASNSISILSLMIILAMNALGVKDNPALQWIQLPVYLILFSLLLLILIRKFKTRNENKGFYLLLVFLVVSAVILYLQLR